MLLSLSSRCVGTAGEPFICGPCYAETCTRCQLEHHPFLSCERYKEFKEEPDSSLKEWCKGNEHVKSCPAAALQLRRWMVATMSSAMQVCKACLLGLLGVFWKWWWCPQPFENYTRGYHINWPFGPKQCLYHYLKNRIRAGGLTNLTVNCHHFFRLV